VRIALDPLPASVRLVAGQTATVKVVPASAQPAPAAAPSPAAPAAKAVATAQNTKKRS
jgi:hypothetical protein